MQSILQMVAWQAKGVHLILYLRSEIGQPASPKQGVHFQEAAAVPLSCLAVEAHAAFWLCGPPEDCRQAQPKP